MKIDSRPGPNRTRLALGGLLMAAVTLFAVNVFSNTTFKSLRLDLTEERLFTVSDGTRAVLAAIDEPITVRLYFSKLLGERSPGHATYYARLRELLEQYADLAGGKLNLEILNPEPFSDIEDRAVAFGLRGLPVNAAGDLGYFGLAATNSTDDEEVIPFLTPSREPFIEYDLTKLIHTLAEPEKKVVGLISTLPIEGQAAPGLQPARSWIVMDQVREFFEVRRLGTEAKEIPNDVDILMIVHPRELSDGTLYAIDQFVLGGGRALVFVDANAETMVLGGPQAGEVGASDFNRLLESWGVSLVEGKVAADLDAARRVEIDHEGRPVITDYVVWLDLSRRNVDTEDAITGNIEALNLASSGILETVSDVGTQIAPLVVTGPRTMRVDVENVRYGGDAIALMRAFQPANETLMLAARISGTAKSAFPDGPPLAADAATSDRGEATALAKPEHITESAESINVVVMADADMLYDVFWVETPSLFGQQLQVPFADNGNFVVNALDNLAGSEQLIGLRGRGTVARPFHLVDRIRREAEQRYRTKEQELLAKLDEVKAEVDRIQSRPGEAAEAILSAEERASLDELRLEMVSLRKELRTVNHALRQDIDRLDSWLKFANIAGIPLLLVIATAVVALVHRRRRMIGGIPS